MMSDNFAARGQTREDDEAREKTELVLSRLPFFDCLERVLAEASNAPKNHNPDHDKPCASPVVFEAKGMFQTFNVPFSRIDPRRYSRPSVFELAFTI